VLEFHQRRNHYFPNELAAQLGDLVLQQIEHLHLAFWN
jgi:hypothetical protein